MVCTLHITHPPEGVHAGRSLKGRGTSLGYLLPSPPFAVVLSSAPFLFPFSRLFSPAATWENESFAPGFCAPRALIPHSIFTTWPVQPRFLPALERTPSGFGGSNIDDRPSTGGFHGIQPGIRSRVSKRLWKCRRIRGCNFTSGGCRVFAAYFSSLFNKWKFDSHSLIPAVISNVCNWN